MHNCNTELAICRNYTRGVACFNRRNCPYHHPPPTQAQAQAQAHVAATDEGTPHRGTGFSVRTRLNVMARPLFFYPSHHIFNLQKLSLHQSPLVKATFTVKGITFSGIAMLDSGCSTCIVPISRLPKEAKKHVTHSDVHIKGINGSITALGELHCNAHFWRYQCIGDNLRHTDSDRTKHSCTQHTRFLHDWHPKRNSWTQTHIHISLHSTHSPNNSSLDITTPSGVRGPNYPQQ